MEVINLLSDEDQPKGASLWNDSELELPSPADVRRASKQMWGSYPSAPSSSQDTSIHSLRSPHLSQNSVSRSSLLDGLDRDMNNWAGIASQPSSSGSRKRKRDALDDVSRASASQARGETTSAKKDEREQRAVDKKADAEKKKVERERLKAERDATKLAKIAEKEKAKVLKSANKLIASKKDTLPDMFVELCYALHDSPEFKPIAHRLRATIVEKAGQPGSTDWPIRCVDELNPLNVICWRRRVTARYDETLRQFVPLSSPQSLLENARLLYLQKDHLQKGMKTGKFEQVVERLRGEMGPKGLLFAMIDGGSRSKEVEKQLTILMLKHRLNVIRVDGADDAATWLYDITADLGFKQHRLIEKSHLPNIGDTKVDTGANAHDTWYKMLLQVHRMTESAAQGIMKQYSTFHSLMSTYEGTGWEGERLLQEILITKRKDGMSRRNLRLGPKLSNRVWRSFASLDHDELLADFGQADNGVDGDDED